MIQLVVVFVEQLDRIDEEPSDEEIWRSVDLARHSQRPYTLDYVDRLFEDFVELHGDRARAEDPALVTGLARFGGRTIALIGQQKGRDINERTRRNFGMAHPEGYRKGMRLMEVAQRHGFPIVTFLDSPGAYPGVAAEQHGQGGAIARSQALMARLSIPLVSCIIGEGNSGGANSCVQPHGAGLDYWASAPVPLPPSPSASQASASSGASRL